MKIKVVQFIYGENNEYTYWFPLAQEINKVYCDTWGYEYVCEHRKSVRQDRNGNWTKIEVMKNNLKDCDYLLYLDADCAFYCHAIAVHEEFVPLLGNRDILVAPDIGGEEHRWWPDHINAGVMLVKNTEKAHEMLTYWDGISDTPEGAHTRHNWPVEQMAFNEFILTKYRDNIAIVKEYYLVQSWANYFIRHFHMASQGNGKSRYNKFKEILDSPMMARNRNLSKIIECQ